MSITPMQKALDMEVLLASSRSYAVQLENEMFDDDLALTRVIEQLISAIEGAQRACRITIKALDEARART